ncbi:LIM domain kinase 2-like [Schistocerca gregaria]|uniref:LIM domain kinase 2-like n=1 Tax=Schistocerca gregaria TaxID=7010 RepID=UPI00211E1CE9|nr:LIM domain kinase 2-like [Schistocerca gregaria]
MKLAVPPVEDWDIKWEDIELGEQIGKGSFGLVFKAKYMGIDVTAKQISGDVEKVKKFHHEASILRSLRHPLIVLWMGVCRCGDKFYLIQEYVSMGSLHSILTNHSIELSWAVCSKMALEISQATLFLHRKGILHRDLKAENVLVEGSEYDLSTTGFFGRCKVADFGLSTLLSDDEVPMSEVGTPWWRAPELSTHHYGPAADVFSFGILLCEIITRRNGDDIRAGMTYERNRLDFATDPELLMKDPELGPLMAMSPPGMKDLAMRCCREDPNERPKTEQLVQELECLSLKFVELSKYCFSMLKKLLLGSDGNDSYHEDILPQLIYVPYKIWVTAVGALIEKDTDVAQLRVPAARVFDLIEKRLQRQMGRCLDELGKQFLSKVMKVQGKNPPIDIKDFSRLWKWVSVFERSIRHRTVLPLFRYGFIHGFVYSRTARQLLLNHGVDGTFIIHSSSSQPDSLIVSYLHKKKLHQVRIKLGALDDPRGGHFILKNSKFKTLTEALSHISNFHATTQRPVLQYVYPNRPIDAPEFQKALLEVERCPGVSRPL